MSDSIQNRRNSLLFRIAPTPSGFLHDGNAANFVAVWTLAKLFEGRVLLRIDDLDRARFRKDYVDDIFKTIEWLDLDIDIGPSGAEDFISNWSQHGRMDIYEKFLDYLANDDRVYGCSCSRTSHHECHCRQKSGSKKPGSDFSLKFHTRPDQVTCFTDLMKGTICKKASEVIGDFIIRKKDGSPSYQLASVADDVHFGVTHIIRGEDLLPSTIAQLELSRKNPWNSFCAVHFLHHRLITGDDMNKLSKSAGDGTGRPQEKSNSRMAKVVRIAGLFIGLRTDADHPLRLLEECREQGLSF